MKKTKEIDLKNDDDSVVAISYTFVVVEEFVVEMNKMIVVVEKNKIVAKRNEIDCDSFLELRAISTKEKKQREILVRNGLSFLSLELEVSYVVEYSFRN